MTTFHKPVNYGPTWLTRREIGLKDPIGSKALQTSAFYRNLQYTNIYNAEAHGGIFSLEFNPEGSLLTAACENKSLLFFDPLNPKLVRTVENAHEDCINCVKYLDSFTFATCSDDYSVALWDIRNLNQRLNRLLGHRNWVKSIDYSSEHKVLVTSGFDGAVLSWDIAQCDNVEERRRTELFLMNGLMRSRMSPDCSKLILSTTAGYLIIVHNLDLETIDKDLEYFRPNLYRLSQLSQQCLMPPDTGTDLFKGPGKRNRVEFVCDFAKDNDAEVISSIQIHPEGHSVLSRNTNHGETSEWTCVHFIEENMRENNDDFEEPWKLPEVIHKSIEPNRVARSLALHQSDITCNPSDVWEAVVAIEDARVQREADPPPPRLPSTLSANGPFHLNLSNSRQGQSPPHLGREWSFVELSRGSARQDPSGLPPFRLRSLRTGYDLNQTSRLLLNAATRFGSTALAYHRHRDVPFGPQRGASVATPQVPRTRVVPLSVFRRPSGDEERGNSMRRHTVAELRIQTGRRNRRDESEDSSSDSEMDENAEGSGSVVNEDLLALVNLRRQRRQMRASRSTDASQYKSTDNPVNRQIHQNVRRLNYYMQEPNVIRGFIKEPSFSPDGRVICSPYKVGVRLLSFSPELQLPWQRPPDPAPSPLHVVQQYELQPFTSGIRDAVVSTKFSPMDNQIVAGTLSGNIFIFSPFR